MWYFAIALALLAGVFGFAFYAYRQTFYAPKKGRDCYEAVKIGQYEPLYSTMNRLIEELAALPFEAVSIRSYDGLTLQGRYYHQKEGAPLQILFHGYRGHAYRDFCGGHQLARELGHNILLLDQRSHGKSQGKSITFGGREAKDCLAWIQYANRRFGEDYPIVLVGVSMGASTVLTAARYDLPGNVKGIIADCPYSSAKDIILKVAKDVHYPPKLVYPFILLGGLCYDGIVLRKKDRPVEAVKQAAVPILLIHGEDDRFVPCGMSGEIFDAIPCQKQRITFPDTAHGVSYLMDAPRYKQAVADFLNQTCGVKTR